MKLNINHYYNMRGWNVYTEYSPTSSAEIETEPKSPSPIMDLISPPIQDILTAESTADFPENSLSIWQ